MATVMQISAWARLMPVQAREPREKGAKLASSVLSRSSLTAAGFSLSSDEDWDCGSQRSGMNVLADGKIVSL